MEQFETFRKFYPYTYVYVYDDQMVYHFPRKYVKSAAEEAEILIRSMNLCLRVEYLTSVVIIKEKENGDKVHQAGGC